mmetsp:Transcript_23160/g.50853  ORF Transcript_23160/g.50853 Transcript_23160/m.50853 type:complete len:339 (-) Transcript_23160:319-1335(-)
MGSLHSQARVCEQYVSVETPGPTTCSIEHHHDHIGQRRFRHIRKIEGSASQERITTCSLTEDVTMYNVHAQEVAGSTKSVCPTNNQANGSEGHKTAEEIDGHSESDSELRVVRRRAGKENCQGETHHQESSDGGPDETHDVCDARHFDGHEHHERKTRPGHAKSKNFACPSWLVQACRSGGLLVTMLQQRSSVLGSASDCRVTSSGEQRHGQSHGGADRWQQVCGNADDESHSEQDAASQDDIREAVVFEDVSLRGLEEGQVPSDSHQGVQQSLHDDNISTDFADSGVSCVRQLHCHRHNVQVAIKGEEQDAEALEEARPEHEPLHLPVGVFAHMFDE